MHTATPEIYTLSLHDALPIYFRDQIFGQLRVLLQGQRNVFQYIQVVEQGSVLVEDAHLLVKQSLFLLRQAGQITAENTHPALVHRIQTQEVFQDGGLARTTAA